MTHRTIVLASSSPYRRTLLGRLHLSFETATPDCDETAGEDEAPSTLVERLARAKANAVAPSWPDSLIIGSDQVAHLDGHTLTKPGNHARAQAQLHACSGRQVIFYTGLCVLDTTSAHASTTHDRFAIQFRDLTAAEIERYLQADTPYDCAGSIRSEGFGVTLFERMEGEDPNALVGLPLIRLAALLRAHGLPLP